MTLGRRQSEGATGSRDGSAKPGGAVVAASAEAGAIAGGRRSSRLDLAITLGTRLATLGSAAAAAVLIAHKMGKEGIGLFGLLRALPAVVLLVTEMGVSVASPYLINSRKLPAQRVLSNALFAGLVVGLVDLALWAVCAGPIRRFFLRGLPTGWVVAAGVLVLLSALEADVHNVLRALGSYRSANLMRVSLEVGILVALAMASLLAVLTNVSMLLLILLMHIVPILIGVVRLSTLGLYPMPHFDRTLLKEAIHFGGRSQVGIAINLLNFRLDHFILSALTDVGTVGVYVVATKTAEFFRFLPAAFAYVLESRFARHDPKKAVTLARRLAPKAFLANIVIMLGAFVLGPRLIPLFFDSWSAEAVPAFRILVVGLGTLGAHGIFASFNLGQGHPELTTYSVAMGFIVTVLLDWVLIPPLGVTGAAIASSISYAVIALTLYYFFRRRSRAISPYESRASSGASVP